MAIQVECGSCFKEYRIKDEKAGASFKCRDCGARIDVPDLDAGDEWDEYEEEVYEPAPRRKPRRKPQKKSAGANPVVFMIIGGAAVLIIGCGVMIMSMGGGGDEAAGVDGGSVVAQADENQTGESAAVFSGSTDTVVTNTGAASPATAAAVPVSVAPSTVADPAATTSARATAVSPASAVPAGRWNVEADPPKSPVQWPTDMKLSMALPEYADREVYYPSTPSPFVAIGIGDSKLSDGLVMNLATGQRAGLIEASWRAKTDFKVSADGKYLAYKLTALNAPPQIEIWSFETGAMLHQITCDVAGMYLPWFDFAADGLIVYTFGSPGTAPGTRPAFGAKYDRRFKLWDIESGEAVSAINADVGNIRDASFALSPGGRYLSFLDNDNEMFVFDLSSNDLAGKLRLPRQADIGYFTCESMQFSDDGSEIAALLDSGQKTLIAIVDVESGQIGERVELGFSIKTGGGISYVASNKIEWLPDSSGWLLFGSSLVDRSSAKVVWQYKLGSPGFIRHRIVVPEGIVFVSGRRPKKLALAEFPFAKIQASLEAMNGEDEAILKPGSIVSIKIAMSDVRGDATDTRQMLGQALAIRLQSDGITVEQDQPLELRLAYGEAAGKILQERRSKGGIPSPFNPGTPTGRSVQATQANLFIELVSANKSLWSHEMQLDPKTLIVRGNASDEQARRSTLNIVALRLKSIPIPYFIPKSKSLVQLPGTTEIP